MPPQMSKRAFSTRVSLGFSSPKLTIATGCQRTSMGSDFFGSSLTRSLSRFGMIQRIAAPKQMSKSAPTRDKRTTTIRERKTKRPGWLLLMPSRLLIGTRVQRNCHALGVRSHNTTRNESPSALAAMPIFDSTRIKFCGADVASSAPERTVSHPIADAISTAHGCFARSLMPSF
jgi:hypothetical protein